MKHEDISKLCQFIYTVISFSKSHCLFCYIQSIKIYTYLIQIVIMNMEILILLDYMLFLKKKCRAIPSFCSQYLFDICSIVLSYLLARLAYNHMFVYSNTTQTHMVLNGSRFTDSVYANESMLVYCDNIFWTRHTWHTWLFLREALLSENGNTHVRTFEDVRVFPKCTAEN